MTMRLARASTSPTLRWVLELAGSSVVLSLVLALVGAITLSRMLASLPADHFVGDRPQTSGALRRTVGLLLVAAGIVMLVTPGPGIVSIVVGLLMLDLRVLRPLLVRLLRRRRVAAAVNAARERAGRPPFVLP